MELYCHEANSPSVYNHTAFNSSASLGSLTCKRTKISNNSHSLIVRKFPSEKKAENPLNKGKLFVKTIKRAH